MSPVLSHLGRREYEPVWRAMQKLTEERDASTPDEIWFLEHPPVYTLGLNGSMEHVLAPGDIPQAALFIGTNTFLLGPPAAPFWHFVSGTFDEFGLPAGLLYSDPSRWIGLLGSLPPYQPRLGTFDILTSICDEEDVSIDDHLAEISVPILYLGAGGGLGTLGDFTSTLTASDDITNFTVSLQPADQRSIDFGHADLFLANDASALAWPVLRDWLRDHSGRARHR